MKTWGVMAILLVIAIAVVLTLGLFHKKVPMFGNAPFGQAPQRQPQSQPPQDGRRDIPVVPSRDVPPPPPVH